VDVAPALRCVSELDALIRPHGAADVLEVLDDHGAA
jgi:hypothetical protein